MTDYPYVGGIAERNQRKDWYHNTVWVEVHPIILYESHKFKAITKKLIIG